MYKTSKLKSSLCNHSDACILVSGTITVTRKGDDAAARQAEDINKEVIFKNCAPFTESVTETNNTRVHNAACIMQCKCNADV